METNPVSLSVVHREVGADVTYHYHYLGFIGTESEETPEVQRGSGAPGQQILARPAIPYYVRADHPRVTTSSGRKHGGSVVVLIITPQALTTLCCSGWHPACTLVGVFSQ